ncbi:MerR family transcriptional regulator [Priestia megaterium]|nr:MerR family transcriptional regulator [Priestia megaterium]
MAMKTVDVAKKLGVHPSTILKWVKLAEIDLERNESGHCEFTEENVMALQEFQQNRNRQAVVKVIQKEEVISDERVEGMQKQLDELLMRVIENEKRNVNPNEEVMSDDRAQELQKQLDQLRMRMIENEKRTEEKAGEVVTFQILEHRSELDQLTKKMTKLQARVEQLENQLENEQLLSAKKQVPKWRTFLTSIFTY